MKRASGLAMGLLCAAPIALTAAQKPLKAELVEALRIWDRGKHNAFTDLVRFTGRWFCVFREGEDHVSPQASIRVLRPENGRDWRSAASIELAGYDLRDPKIAVAGRSKRLMLLCAAAVREGKQPASLSKSFVTFSKDGTKWEEPHWVGTENRWLWRITWFAGKAYGVDYDVAPPSRAARSYGTAFLQSSDGLHFATLVPQLQEIGGPTEATLQFAADGTCYRLQRRDGKSSNTALLGESRPPYSQWRWRDLGMYFGGPNLILLPDGRWIAAGRLMNIGDQPGPKTVICALDVNQALLTPLLSLPSDGDTSYPGLVWHKGLLWVSYYSSHEGKTGIYLAKVRLSPVKS